MSEPKHVPLRVLVETGFLVRCSDRPNDLEKRLEKSRIRARAKASDIDIIIFGEKGLFSELDVMKNFLMSRSVEKPVVAPGDILVIVRSDALSEVYSDTAVMTAVSEMANIFNAYVEERQAEKVTV